MLPKNKRVKSQKTIDEIRAIGFCEYCGNAWQALHVHHITSRGAGGGDVMDNLVCLCVSCHAAAHTGEIGLDELRRIVRYRNGR